MRARPQAREGSARGHCFQPPQVGFQPSQVGFQPSQVGVVAERMEAALAPRVWTVKASERPRRCHVFLVSRGSAVASMDQRSDIGLSAPAALWLPLGAGGRFQLPAGGEGFAVSMAEDVAWRVIGGNAAAPDLRVLLDRAAIVTSERLAPNLPELSISMTVLLRETREQLPGGSTMIDLHLGLVLVQLWRIAAGAVSAPARRSAGLTTAQAFSQLIEAHFREDLTVADYAARLGVSRAHLNGACLRAAERTPLAMINQRRIEEAKLRLRQSKLSVEEVGYALGFRDPGYFNRFFKRLTGQRPGAYRRMAAAPAVIESFAAWP